jgi:hypothetical protein
MAAMATTTTHEIKEGTIRATPVRGETASMLLAFESSETGAQYERLVTCDDVVAARAAPTGRCVFVHDPDVAFEVMLAAETARSAHVTSARAALRYTVTSSFLGKTTEYTVEFELPRLDVAAASGDGSVDPVARELDDLRRHNRTLTRRIEDVDRRFTEYVSAQEELMDIVVLEMMEDKLRSGRYGASYESALSLAKDVEYMSSIVGSMMELSTKYKRAALVAAVRTGSYNSKALMEVSAVDVLVEDPGLFARQLHGTLAEAVGDCRCRVDGLASLLSVTKWIHGAGVKMFAPDDPNRVHSAATLQQQVHTFASHAIGPANCPDPQAHAASQKRRAEIALLFAEIIAR